MICGFSFQGIDCAAGKRIIDGGKRGYEMKRNYELDMCDGPLLSHIIIFALPLMLSGILQLLFNAADIIVVGRFTGSEALAAVGSTSSLINLLVNLFLGISVGGNVLMARYCGARDEKNARETVHTAICISIIGGVFMIFIGNLLARPLLEWMGTPADVIDLSVIYMRIYFLGMPAFITYDFGAALLRAVGDTRRPLYFLLAAGIINVIFNLVFVIVFRLGVAGVALATIIAQSISAVLVLICLIRSDGVLHLCKGELRIHPDKVKGMLRIGLPAGIQGCIFNISNVLIQSSVNSFGSLVMAGNTAASNIEGFVYTSMNAVYQTSLSFTGQNMGARNYQRVDRILFMCLGVVAVVGIVMGGGAVLFGTPLLGIYTNDPQVIAYGLQRLHVVALTYFLCGIMDTLVGSLRGIGYSLMPMIVSLSGACLFRVFWIFTIFQAQHTQFSLYVSYPISWILTAGIHAICYLAVRRRAFAKREAECAALDR